MRLTLRTAAMAGLLLLCLPLHVLWRLAGRHSPWPRRFLAGITWAAGFRVSVEGRPLRSHVLFVANHLSWADIPILAGATGAAFVSRDDVRRWPLIGWLAAMNRTIFVDRSARAAVRGQADVVREALATGQPVALFPEGTTDGRTAILPFRASLLSSLFPPVPGLSVQPVAIDYGAAAEDVAWVGEESALANARRILARPGHIPVMLRMLDPIDPSNAGDRKDLAALSRQRIVAALSASASGPDPL